MDEKLFNWATADILESRIDAPYYSREHVRNARWMSQWTGDLRSIDLLSSLVTDGTHVTPTYYPGMKVARNSMAEAYRTEGWRK